MEGAASNHMQHCLQVTQLGGNLIWILNRGAGGNLLCCWFGMKVGKWLNSLVGACFI